MYKVYLSHAGDKVSNKTVTADRQVAATAYDVLVNKTVLDQTSIFAILIYNNTELARHDFSVSKGHPDHWRDRTEEIEWPHDDTPRKPGRPKTGNPTGKRRNVYMDDASWEIALKIGNGNISEGIRVALEAVRHSTSYK